MLPIKKLYYLLSCGQCYAFLFWYISSSNNAHYLYLYVIHWCILWAYIFGMPFICNDFTVKGVPVTYHLTNLNWIDVVIFALENTTFCFLEKYQWWYQLASCFACIFYICSRFYKLYTCLIIILLGVISELARERVEREQQLMKTGTQSEDLAKTTQQLVENRDIKALVKIAAEGINQQSENNCEC